MNAEIAEFAGVVLIVFGKRTPEGQLTPETKEDCRYAVMEYRQRTQPSTSFNGCTVVKRKVKAPGAFILVSTETTEEGRRRVTEMMHDFLIKTWQVPRRTAITLRGRRLGDIVQEIRKRRFDRRKIILVRKNPRFPKLSLLWFSFRKNGFSLPEYVWK